MITGAVAGAALMALHTRLWEPACEPQNIQAYDMPEKGRLAGSESFESGD